MTKHDKRKFHSDEDLQFELATYEGSLDAAQKEMRLLESFVAVSRDLVHERERYNQEHETRLGLETRLRERGARMHEIEECRVFESETEHMLVECLDEILRASDVGTAGNWHATRMLDKLADRKGPRP